MPTKSEGRMCKERWPTEAKVRNLFEKGTISRAGVWKEKDDDPQELREIVSHLQLTRFGLDQDQWTRDALW